MKWINRHTYTIPKAFPEGNAHKRTLFQNHPNLLKRDNYPSAKLQIILENQGDIREEFLSSQYLFCRTL